MGEFTIIVTSHANDSESGLRDIWMIPSSLELELCKSLSIKVKPKYVSMATHKRQQIDHGLQLWQLQVSGRQAGGVYGMIEAGPVCNSL